MISALWCNYYLRLFTCLAILKDCSNSFSEINAFKTRSTLHIQVSLCTLYYGTIISFVNGRETSSRCSLIGQALRHEPIKLLCDDSSTVGVGVVTKNIGWREPIRDGRDQPRPSSDVDAEKAGTTERIASRVNEHAAWTKKCLSRPHLSCQHSESGLWEKNTRSSESLHTLVSTVCDVQFISNITKYRLK